MRPLKFGSIGLLVLVLLSCGGGSGSSLLDVTGRWIGTIQLDTENSCVVGTSSEFLDLPGQSYTLDVSALDAENRKVVVDQDGILYEQFYPEGIHNGEFVVNSTEPPAEPGIRPNGPTGIHFFPNDGSVATVEIFVFYNRFCTSVFVGEFRNEAQSELLQGFTISTGESGDASPNYAS